MNRNKFYLSIFMLLPLISYFFSPVSLGDLSIWTAMGLDTLRNSRLLEYDPFTVSETTKMIYPAFLTVLYALLYNAGGTALLVVLHGMVPSVWVFIWYRFLKQQAVRYRNAASYWDAASLIVFPFALIGSSLVYIPRPALLATLPLLISYTSIVLLQQRKLRTADMAMFAFLETVWVNIHGSFLILPVMLGWEICILIAARDFKFLKSRLINLSLVSIVILLNPHGWQVVPYTWQTASVSFARGLDEWFPPSRFDFPVSSWLFYLSSLILFICIVKKLKERSSYLPLFSDPIMVLWLSGFFAIRNTFLIFLVLPVFFFNRLCLKPAVNTPVETKYSRVINLLLAAALLAAAILLSPFLKAHLRAVVPAPYSRSYDQSSYPDKALAYLNENSGNVFNSWQFGSELSLSQKNRHYIDTRNIIFTDKVNDEYDLFLANPEKGVVDLEKYDFRFFLIHEKHGRVLEWLNRNRAFTLVVEDPPSYLYEKRK